MAEFGSNVAVASLPDSAPINVTGGKTEFLNNDVGFLQNFYHNEELLTVKIGDTYHVAPYTVVYAFQPGTESYETWGRVTLNGQFQFPENLQAHKDEMVHTFTERGMMKKDNPATRVTNATFDDKGELVLDITAQNAKYSDQVGSNLTVDSKEFEKHGIQKRDGSGEIATTVREYDQVEPGKLPSFEQSELANTIGVAVAIVAPESHEKDAPHHVLKRFRSEKNVAVYGGTWHVPLSFAFSQPSDSFDGTVKDMMKFDFQAETLEEMGLKKEELGEAQPLALLRDLGRAGKPQYIFVVKSKLTIGEIQQRIKDNGGDLKGEFGDNVEMASQNDMTSAESSPELVAAMLLVEKQNQALRPH